MFPGTDTPVSIKKGMQEFELRMDDGELHQRVLFVGMVIDLPIPQGFHQPLRTWRDKISLLDGGTWASYVILESAKCPRRFVIPANTGEEDLVEVQYEVKTEWTSLQFGFRCPQSGRGS